MDYGYAVRLTQEELGTAEGWRRRIHNAIEDRKGNIRLFCRVRPSLPSEPSVFVQRDAFSIEIALEPLCKLMKHKEKQPTDSPAFSFDACWTPGSQAEVFTDAKDLVQSAVDGYNITIFAYGQTGAGKTWTMYGPKESEKQGVCPRAVHELFEIMAKRKDDFEFSVTLSMYELYCKHFLDVLDAKAKKTLRIRTSPHGETYIENASEHRVHCVEEVRRLVDSGFKERHSRDTQMNIGSSRSHLFLCLRIISRCLLTGKQVCGKMMLVDLAGSERMKRSGVEGDAAREAIEINTSLSALGDVIQALVRGDSHVPYRNHELTQVLQDSLGGTSKTLMFVNLSSAACDLEESLTTIRYAQRAKNVVNDAAIGVIPALIQDPAPQDQKRRANAAPHEQKSRTNSSMSSRGFAPPGRTSASTSLLGRSSATSFNIRESVLRPGGAPPRDSPWPSPRDSPRPSPREPLRPSSREPPRPSSREPPRPSSRESPRPPPRET